MLSPLAWARRRDPTLTSIRRAVRVTVVACLGFYVCRYWLGNAAMATYALFGAVALGALAQIPGTPAQRSRTLLAVLPFGYVLVTAGTLLSVSNWTAAAGMLVFGFVVSYAGVGGPRLVGLATGLQLLYILPCFPPYNPASLPYRLAGLTIAVLLLAAAELVLWPDPAPPSYPLLLGGVLAVLADAEVALAGTYLRRPDGPDPAAMLARADEAAQAIRPSRLQPAQRPASAGRRDRALTHAGGLTRMALARVTALSTEDAYEALHTEAVGGLLADMAASTAAAARCLRDGTPPPDIAPITRALDAFRALRVQVDPDGVDPDRLRVGSLALAVGEWTTTMVTAVRVTAGAPILPDTTPPGARPGPFWYAYQPGARLWWRRFREHLNPRSVYFQGAIRLALALAVARLVAGVLDLSHGFWVLLATLTLLRTSAADTRSALRPALTGTVVGSVIAAGLFLVATEPPVYIIGLPIAMLVGFAAGPLLGPGYGQALFTLVVALIFGQLAPESWRLAETRILDVAIGATIGVLIGLFAWPRGGAGELHRATGDFLAASSVVVRETVGVLAAGAPPGHALPEARRQGQFAEACYALYQTERHGPAAVDWQATLNAGHHAVRGAEASLRSFPDGRLISCAGPLNGWAATVAGGYDRLAAGLIARHRPALPVVPADPGGWPRDLGLDLYHLADLRVWLDGLADDLVRVAAPPATQAAST